MAAPRSFASVTLAFVVACGSGGADDDSTTTDGTAGASGSGTNAADGDDGNATAGDGSGSDGAVDGSDGGSDGSDTGEPVCQATGFVQSPLLWQLPPISVDVGEPDALDEFGQGWTCANDEHLAYATTDLDGDGALDLVFVDYCDAADVGETGWLVHRGGSDGFADDPSLWHLPELGVDLGDNEPFDQLAQGWTCANDEALYYSLLDLTADGLVDLVVTDRCDAGDTGATAWLVFAGGADGFADDPALWHLPDDAVQLAAMAGQDDAFGRLADGWTCTNDEALQYVTVDLTADGIVDLVVTDRCDAADTGADGWLVYPGGADGFADDPLLWHLPTIDLPLAEPDLFDRFGDGWTCDNDQSFRYRLLDLDADRRLDLVVTDLCDSAGAGAEGWLVYAGDDQGFSDTPSMWHLPQIGDGVDESDVLDDLANGWTCTNDRNLRYSTIDLTGDGIVDLVVTDACDMGDAGATAWLVYPGGGDGFADAPAQWALPMADAAVDQSEPYDQLGQGWTCTNDASFRYGLLGLDADPHLDLVVTDACDAGDVGITGWLVYAGQCG